MRDRLPVIEHCRFRVGQKYLESGTEREPDVVYVEVVSLDPLLVARERWAGRDPGDPEPYDAGRLHALPLVSDPEMTSAEIREALVGRRIVAVDVYEDHDRWRSGHGDVTLHLDDGHRVEFCSWGYDAFGTATFIKPPLGGDA